MAFPLMISVREIALKLGCVTAEAQIIEMTQNEAKYGSDSIVSLGIDQ